MNDVDYNTAAAASCVRPVVFKKALGVARIVLNVESSKPRTEKLDNVVTYEELMQTFRLRNYQEVLLGWFRSAEAALIGSGELRGLDSKASNNQTLLKCVVFAWVCEVSKVRSSRRLSCLGSKLNLFGPLLSLNTWNRKRSD